MGLNKTVIDSSSPVAIATAIMKVNRDPAKRSDYGIKALWKIFNAPGHAVLRSEMDNREGVLDLHFGWFCRRVAEELGMEQPDALALVDYSTDAEGRQTLKLKSAVVAAMLPHSHTATQPSLDTE